MLIPLLKIYILTEQSYYDSWLKLRCLERSEAAGIAKIRF